VNPIARTDDLVITDADGDTLVYDLRSHRAHSLDGAAALLWRLCDGTRDLPTLAAALAGTAPAGEQGDAAVSPDDVVRYALARLARAELVRDVPSTGGCPLSRRTLLRRAGAAGAALLVPTILSVVAPTTLQAQASCLPGGADCTNQKQGCCPGLRCRNLPQQPPGNDLRLCL
jgi:hypothetical protein